MKDDKVYGLEGTSYTAEYWQYDSRLGRRWNVDPKAAQFPWQSPYCAFDNNPVNKIDPDGQAATDPPSKDKVLKGEGASAVANRNNISLDQLAQYNPDVFKNYDQYENKSDYWKNTDKNYMLHPDQKLNTSDPTANQSDAPQFNFSFGLGLGGNSPSSGSSTAGIMSTVGKTTFIMGAAGTMLENTSGSFRVFRTQGRFSPKYYPNMGGTGQRAVGFGIKTFNVAKVGSILGWGGIGITTAFDIYGMRQYYRYGSNHPNAVHPGKAGLNLGMGAYGMWVNPPAAIMCLGIDAFYPGGWPAAMKNMDDVQKANQKILGPQWRIIPFNKF